MEIESIIKLIQAVSDSELTDFYYGEGDTTLEFTKGEKEVVVKEVSPSGAIQPAVPIATVPIVQQPAVPLAAVPEFQQQTASVAANETAPVTLAPQREEEAAAQPEVVGEEVKSPLVGTFYSAPSPEDEPFVRVGDAVKKGQTLGIVEAMKLMNEIESEYDGVVKAILVENEEVVEYGQPLFVIG